MFGERALLTKDFPTQTQASTLALILFCWTETGQNDTRLNTGSVHSQRLLQQLLHRGASNCNY